jgi:hypothetical protein
MPAAPRSPLDGTARIVVDGSNLLHRLGPDAPPSTLIGRLRAAIPVDIAIELFFDGVGHGVTGRVAQAMHVRYSGRRTGDEAILELVGDGRSATGPGPVATAGTLVITDDRDLRTAVTARGARTAGVAWLLGRMDVAAVAPPTSRRSSIGAGRPPRGGPGAVGSGGAGNGDESAEQRGWRPGRGATAKTGTAHKVARHRRHPRHP